MPPPSLSSGRTIARSGRSACSKAAGRPLEDKQKSLPKVTLTPVSSPAPQSVTISVPLSSSLSASTTENNGEQRGGSNHTHASVGCVPADCSEDWSDQDRPQSCTIIDPLWPKFILLPNSTEIHNHITLQHNHLGHFWTTTYYSS